MSVYPNNAIPRPDDYDKEFVPEVYLAVTVWWVGDCSATPSAVEAVSFYRGGLALAALVKTEVTYEFYFISTNLYSKLLLGSDK